MAIPPEFQAKAAAIGKTMQKVEAVMKTQAEGATKGSDQPKMDADFQRAATKNMDLTKG